MTFAALTAHLRAEDLGGVLAGFLDGFVFCYDSGDKCSHDGLDDVAIAGVFATAMTTMQAENGRREVCCKKKILFRVKVTTEFTTSRSKRNIYIRNTKSKYGFMK